MTPTIIPYPKFLTKPWRCMALQAVHCQAVHRLAIHRSRHCAYINVASPSIRPSPSHCRQAVHRQAIAPSIAKRSLAKPFIAVTIKPSIAIASLHHRCVADQAVHRHRIAVEPTIKLSIAVGSFHRRCVAVMPSIANPLRSPSPSHPPPSHPLPSHPLSSPLRQPAKPFISVAVALPLTSCCCHEVHPHCFDVKSFIAKPSCRPLPGHPSPSHPSPSHPSPLPLCLH